MLRALTYKPSPIGLDIGYDSIKMLQLDAVGKAITVVAAARWAFPDNVRDDEVLRRRSAVDAVGELLKTGSFKGRRVVTCLSHEQMIIKQIRLPHMPPEEMQRAVLPEACERFGFDVQPELLHHVIAGEVHQGSEKRDEVILLGVRSETVEDHLQMLTEMRLVPVALDAEPACLFRSFDRFLQRGEDSKKITVLVDIGASTSRILFGRGRQVKFIKSIAIGGRRLDEAVAKQLNLEVSEGAALRRQVMRHGCDGGEDAIKAASGEQVYHALYDAVRPGVEELARELSLCLRYCAVTFRGCKPEDMILLGGEAYDPCLRELISEYTSIPCRIGRPLQGLDLSQVELGSDHRGPLCEWAVASGLALRDLFAGSKGREGSNGRHRLSA